MFLQPGAGTAQWNQIIEAGLSLTDAQFFGLEIAAWKDSPRRRAQLDGERYYRGDQDILRRKRMAIGAGGQLKEVHNLPTTKSSTTSTPSGWTRRPTTCWAGR